MFSTVQSIESCQIIRASSSLRKNDVATASLREPVQETIPLVHQCEIGVINKSTRNYYLGEECWLRR
jgi:hypothetical protein